MIVARELRHWKGNYMIIKELITYLSLLWKIVVLCLRFRTGTQILIYFPVLLQTSFATSGQLLWERHVKAPQWLMNLSPFSKRGIAADSQREKHMAMLTTAKAIPKVSVLPHHLPVLSAKRPPALGEWLPSEWSWKMSRRWHGREGSAAPDLLWVLLEQAVLGIAPSHGFQVLLSFHWWLISGEVLDVMAGSVQAEDARIDVVSCCTLKETETPGCLHPAWVKKERTKKNHLSQGQLVSMWKNFTWFTAHPHPSDSAVKPTSKNLRETIRKRGSFPSCSQSVKQNCNQDTVLPFSSFDPWASLSGLGTKCLFVCQCRI